MAVKSAISFGLVHIPVSLHAAVQNADVGFNQLHSADGARVRYKKVCAECGKELKLDEIVRGYEYEKDKYVIISDEDLGKIKSETDKSMQILSFAAEGGIPVEYFDRSFHILPEKGGERAFELLRAAMKKLGKIAVAKTVFGEKETLVALFAHANGIFARELHFSDELKDAPKAYQTTELKSGELDMAARLIEAMQGEFEPQNYKNEYREKLRALLEAKIAGREIDAPRERAHKNVGDLMDALKSSLSRFADGGARERAPRTPKALAKKPVAKTAKKPASAPPAVPAQKPAAKRPRA